MNLTGARWGQRAARACVLAAAATLATVSIASSAGGGANGVPATSQSLNFATAAAAIPASHGGGFYVADAGNNVVRRVDAAGKITTVAGNGTAGDTGDGGPATQATLNGPTDAVPTPDGGILIAEGNPLGGSGYSRRVRKVSATGIITTVAGGASSVCALHTDPEGDNCPATQATLGLPTAAIPTSDGGILITDNGAGVIRKVSSNGIITRVAGNASPPPCSGQLDSIHDGCSALQASLSSPTAAIPFNIAGAGVGTSGQGFLITEEQGCRVRYVDGSGVIHTVAGSTDPSNPCRVNGDPLPGSGLPATSIKLSLPTDARPTPDGGFLVADTKSCVIRKVSSVNPGATETIIANTGCDGTEGIGTTAAIPSTAAGNFLVADTIASKVDSSTPAGILTVVAGTGTTGYNVEPPVISGTPSPGHAVSCSQGRWSNSPTAFDYVWKDNGSLIPGATHSSYTIAIPLGHSLTCTVTAHGPMVSSTATSAPVAISGGTPRLTSLRIRPSKFKAAAAGATVLAIHAPKKPGAIVSFVLNLPAKVSFSVMRFSHGRKNSKGRCVAQTKHNRNAKRCKLVVRVGGFSFAGHSGANSLRFSGRLKGRRLAPGSYGLSAKPGSGRPGTASFKVVR